MLVYADSVILIYYLEYTGDLQTRAAAYLAPTFAANGQLAISDLTRLECRVKPMRVGDGSLVAKFDNFFSDPGVVLIPLTSTVYDRATRIRADYGFKLGDSLHLAAAVEHGCDRFATNDLRLSKFPDIPVELLP